MSLVGIEPNFLSPSDGNLHKVECRKGEFMPDGSTSVVLDYYGGHYYFPDGSIMIGVHQVLCAKRKHLQ